MQAVWAQLLRRLARHGIEPASPDQGPMDFPQRLIEGYSAFLAERLPREQSRFRELAETGQRPEIMVIGCCDLRVSPEVSSTRGRANCSWCATSPISSRLMRRTDRRTAYRRRSNSASAHCASNISWCSAMPAAAACGLCRRHRQSAPAFVARRLHRQMDGTDRARGRQGRSARRCLARRLSGAAGASQYRQQPRQPDDVSAARQADREGQDRRARRLFRRGDGRIVGAGSRRAAAFDRLRSDTHVLR